MVHERRIGYHWIQPEDDLHCGSPWLVNLKGIYWVAGYLRGPIYGNNDVPQKMLFTWYVGGGGIRPNN